MKHYIYVDDIRENADWYNSHLTPDWQPHVCRTAQRTIDFITAICYSGETAQFILDLDHDLGEGHEMDDYLVSSGYDICKYIVENQISLMGFHIHSMNPVGVTNMRQLLTHYGYREI